MLKKCAFQHLPKSRPLLPDVLDRGLRVPNRAEFRPAHRAVLVVGRRMIDRFLVHFLRRLRIERKLELPRPVEIVPRPAHFVVPVLRMRPMTGHVGGMSGDLVRDHPRPNVVDVRKAQVLFRRDVAEHRNPVVGRERSADGTGDVVVPRPNVADERTEDVERRLVAPLDLVLHVLLDLVHRHVARPFDHNLAPVFPRLEGQLAHDLQLGKLRLVGRVGDAARTQTVAEAPGHIVSGQNFAKLVKMRVERVFLLVDRHPLRHERPAAGNDPERPLRRQRDEVTQERAVDRHVIDPLLRLELDDPQKIFRLHVLDFFQLLRDLVKRDGPERHVRVVDDRLADLVNMLAGRKVHHRIGAAGNRAADLGQLAAQVALDRRIAEIGVDFGPAADPDSARNEAFLQVDPVGGNDEPPAGDFIPDRFDGQKFLFRDEFHFRRYAAGQRFGSLCFVHILDFSGKSRGIEYYNINRF